MPVPSLDEVRAARGGGEEPPTPSLDEVRATRAAGPVPSLDDVRATRQAAPVEPEPTPSTNLGTHAELLRLKKVDEEKQAAKATARKLVARDALIKEVTASTQAVKKAAGLLRALPDDAPEEQRRQLQEAYSDIAAHSKRRSSMALAKYLQAYGPEGQRKHVEAAAQGRLEAEQPGKKGAFATGVDVFDAAVSPLSRPLYSVGSAVADIDALREMGPEAGRAWVARLHPDDTRRGAYEQVIQGLEAGDNTWKDNLGQLLPDVIEDAVGLGNSPDERRAAARNALEMAYWKPGEEDPYGGTGIPHPWQDLDEQGRIMVDQPPAELADIYMRALSSKFGAALPETHWARGVGPDSYAGVHREMQRLFGSGQAAVAATVMNPGATPPAEWLLDFLKRRREVEKAINPQLRTAADIMPPEALEGLPPEARAIADEMAKTGQWNPKTGMFMHDVLMSASPDMFSPRTAVGLLMDPRGTTMGARRTAAGFLTEAGDRQLTAQGRLRATEALEARAAQLGRALTEEEAKVLQASVDSKVNAAFVHAGVEASKVGETVRSIDTSRAVSLTDEGLVRLDYDEIRWSGADEVVAQARGWTVVGGDLTPPPSNIRDRLGESMADIDPHTGEKLAKPRDVGPLDAAGVARELRGKTGADVARWLATDSSVPVHREVMHRIAPHLENVKIVVGDAPSVAARGATAGTASGESRLRFVGQGEVEVTIFRDGLRSEVIAHELVHAATQTRIRMARLGRAQGFGEVNQAVQKIEDIRRKVRRASRGRAPEWLRYALSSPDEFIAHGLTSPRTQEFLRGVDLGGRVSALSAFLRRIGTILGFGKDRTALSGLFEATDELLAAEMRALTEVDWAQVGKPRRRPARERLAARRSGAAAQFRELGGELLPPLIAPARTPLGNAANKAVRGIIQAAPDAIQKPLAIAADMPRRLLNFGRRRPFATRTPTYVVKGEGKTWRAVGASDLVDDHRWEAMAQALGRHRHEISAMKAEVDALVFDIGRLGGMTSKQRELLQKFAEVLPNPSDEAVLGARILGGLEALLNEVVTALPRQVIEREVGLASRRADLARSALADANTAADDAFMAYQRARGDEGAAAEALRRSDEALASAREAAGELGGTDAAAAAARVVEAKEARRVAMKRVIAATKAAKRAKGTADEAAARAAKKKASAEAAAAQAAAFRAELAAKKAGPAPAGGAGGADRATLRRLEDARDKAAREATIAEARAQSAQAAWAKAQRALDDVEDELVAASTRSDRLAGVAEDAAALEVRGAGLLDDVLPALDSSLQQARMARQLMEDLTGFEDVAAFKQVAGFREAIDEAIVRADDALADADIHRAFAEMTVSDLRQAERAANRYGGSAAAARRAYADLTDGQRKAVDRLRGFYDTMYKRLKAEGRLPKGWTRERFYERMRVEGYTRHMLTSKGIRAAEHLKKGLSTELEMLKGRTKAGTVEEINQLARQDVARMLLRERVGDAARHIWDDPNLIEVTIREHGLDKIKYFETDAVRLAREYGHEVSVGLANDRLLMRLLDIFPEGEMFAAAATNPELRLQLGRGANKPVDVLAEEAGFLRVPGATRARLSYGQGAWSGWAKYKAEIDNIIRNLPPEERTAAFLKLMDDAGVPAGSLYRQQVEDVVQDIYLPRVVVDQVKYFSEPEKWLDGLNEAMSKSGFDDYLAFWKAGATVGAISFHGRNALSNTLQALLKFGPETLSPTTQIDAHRILAAPDDKVLAFEWDGAVVQQTAAKWREQLSDIGVDTVNIGPADVERALRDLRVDVPAGLKTSAVSAALGALYGGFAGPKQEGESFSVRGAFGAALIGGTGGAAVRGLHDIYLSGRFGASREAADLSLSESFGAVLADIGEAMKPGARVGAWSALLGSLAGIEMTPEGASFMDHLKNAATTGALAGAGGAGLRVLGEGLFAIGGGVGQAVERQARIATYITARKKGFSHSAAANAVQETLFDYGDLTAFERYAMRRAMPFYCVSEDTECLTRRGWVTYDQIREDDELLTYNVEDDTTEWQTHQGVAVFDYVGELVHLKDSGAQDWLVTDDHRWPVSQHTSAGRGRRATKRHIIRTHEIRSRHQRFVLAAPHASFPEESVLSDRHAAILGWVVTDGYCRWRGRVNGPTHCEMVVYQSPQKHLDEVAALLGSDLTRKPHPTTGVHAVNVRAADVRAITAVYRSKEDLPGLVGRLSRSAAVAMWDAMNKAEASVDDRTEKASIQFVQRPGPVMDAYQTLTLLLGKTGVVRPRAGGCATLYVKHGRFSPFEQAKRSRVPYAGKVWCPKTPNSTWVMRRNGRPVFTGNTWTRKNLELQAQLMLGRPHEYSALTKLINVVQKPTIESGDLQFAPEYLRYRLVVNTGLGRMVAGFGLPQESVVELTKDFGAGMLHPFVAYGIRMGGRDHFYQTDVTQVRGARDVRYLPPWIQDYVGYRHMRVRGKDKYEVGWWQNDDGSWRDLDARKGAYRLALLRAFPAWRLVSEFNKGVTDRFMQGASSMAGDAEATGAERFLALTTGLKPYATNVKRWKEWAWRDAEERLLQDLENAGLLDEATYLRRVSLASMPQDEVELLQSLFGPPAAGGNVPANP